MFEQTLLTQPASARKTGAIALSFVAQMLVAGVLVVAPLIYTQTLPFLAARLPGVVFTKAAAPPPPVSTTIETATTSTPTRVPSRVFVPTQVPKGSPHVSEVTLELGPSPVDITGIGVPEGIPIPDTTGVATIIGTPAPPIARTIVAQPPEITTPVRISGGVLAAKLITQIVPKYPALARQTRVSGTVRLLGVIARDGRVRDLRVLDGPPLLRQAALDAVGQWVYAPTLLGGQPVEVEAPIEVHFQLN